MATRREREARIFGQHLMGRHGYGDTSWWAAADLAARHEADHAAFGAEAHTDGKP